MGFYYLKSRTQNIRQVSIQRTMLNLLKKFFREFDMFNSPATLRTKGEPEARNTCAGIFSFLILLVFAYVFISQFIQATNWQNISSMVTQNNTVDPNSSRNISNFMIGVGLEGFRIEGIMEYLRFEVVQVLKNGSAVLTRRNLLTEKCREDHWQQLGDQSAISQNYIRYNLKNKLCLVLNQELSIQQPSNGVYSVLVVQVNACRRMDRQNNFLYSGCASENMTNSKNQQWIQFNKYFVVNVVYLNTVFNPLNKMATHKTLESQRLTFTISQGAEAFIYLSTYEIQTDTSIWPVQSVEVESGYSFDKNELNVFQIVWYFEHASCTFLLSSTSLLYDRNIGKVDELLSYAGGLFGIIIVVLGLFMMSFDQYRYELMAAESAFNYNNEGKKIHEENFTFFLYIKYEIFDWIKTLFCYEIQWADCKQIDETRQQSTQQLDISLILKKLVYFQKFIEHAVSDKQKIALFLTEHPPIEQVRRNRLIAEYYDKVLQREISMTMENVVIANGIFEMISQQRIGSQTEINDSRGQLLGVEDRTIEKILERYDKEYGHPEDINFNEEERQIEKEIALAFFSLPSETRKKFMAKIPLKILSRLYRIKNQQFQTRLMSINLQI